MNVLELIGRQEALFTADIAEHEAELSRIVAESRFLVIGGAGSIGQAVTREIFKRKPKVLHVVDISENNMVELVRDVRSTLGYIEGDFSTFAIDCGSRQYDALIKWSGGYDYVLNLSALKHVRSEKDPFTLMRMVDVNVLNTISTIESAKAFCAKKYFCVSTDKAANPVNMMGASKRIMEMFLMRASESLPISTARFANVAFSDGSLLHGFNQRFAKRQPISAPKDVRRYFVTPQESGELCLMSCLLGENRDIFFPKLSEKLHLITFADIAVRYLSVLFGGAMSGLAGGYLSLVYTLQWVENMTSGRGWIALALVVFASWLPLRILAGAYLFGTISILSFVLQAQGLGIPSQFLSSLPYLGTILALVVISGNKALTRRNTPASLGQPFVPDR